MADDDANEWVQIRSFADPGTARMTLDFLRHHDIEAETRGDSPDGVRQLYKEFDIRIVVRRHQLDEAAEALEALTSDASEGAPFRGPLPAPELAEEGAAPAAELRNKKGAFAMVLAFLVPFGGGHFYAEHTQTGIALAVGAVLAILFARGGIFSPSAWLALIAVDALTSLVAIRRYRARAVPSAAQQRALGAGLVVVAFVIAAILDATR